MGRKKGGLASIFSSKPRHPGASSPAWPWPSACATKPQTASFRGGGAADDRRPRSTAAGGGDDMYRTVNSVYFDGGYSCRSLFDFDDGGGGSFSTAAAASEEWSEAVIRSLGRTSTDRFFFDAAPAAAATARTPPPAEPPKLPPPSAAASGDAAPGLDYPDDDSDKEDPATTSLLVEESVAVALDSEDPFRDFRASMAEMVAAHGLRDWAALQEMLLWYLRINGKRNHALIVGAFVDLLVGLAASSRADCASSTTAATTTTTNTTATWNWNRKRIAAIARAVAHALDSPPIPAVPDVVLLAKCSTI